MVGDVVEVEDVDPVEVVLELDVSGMVGELELPPPPPPQEAKTTKNNVRMIDFILDKTSCLLSGWYLYGEF